MTHEEIAESCYIVAFSAVDVNNPIWNIIIDVLEKNIPDFHVGYGTGSWMAFTVPKEFTKNYNFLMH